MIPRSSLKFFGPLLAIVGLSLTAQQAADRPIAITGVTVIDGASPTARVNQTVLVRGNRIIAVGPAAATRPPRDARVIDGSGRFLVPGYWDMHVHTVTPGGREVLALYVANGVLGVRDLAGEWPQLTAWRREIADGRLVGPRLIISGPYIEGGDVPIPHILARNPAEARAAVDSLVKLRVDVIKLHSQLTRDVYLAALRAARERGMRTAGHVPRTITAREASDSGLTSIEHMLQIPTPCTPADSLALRPRFAVQSVLGRCTSEDLAPLFAVLARNGTWVVPTLVAGYEIAHWPKRDLPGDVNAPFLPDSLRRFVTEIFPMPDSIPADADVVGMALWQKRIELAGAMHRAGVAILPGTDAPLRNSTPGFGLHEELSLFKQAGLSNFEVFRAATYEPARYLGALDSLGTVGVGKIADLVLLNANPLDDVRNLKRIQTVIANGRVVDPAALLADARRRNQPRR